jgi:spore germination protein YaaH
MNKQTPVFYSHSGNRWQLFLGTVRIGVAVGVVFCALFVAAFLYRSSPIVPALTEKDEGDLHFVVPDSIGYVNRKQINEYEKMRDQLTSIINTNKVITDDAIKSSGKINRPALMHDKKIHAGFFVNWDFQSWQSLLRNIKNLNMVIPEWYALNDTNCSIVTDIKSPVLDTLHRHAVPVFPMFSNYFSGQFRIDGLKRILNVPKETNGLIQRIDSIVEKNDYAGVNINFECLDSVALRTMPPFVNGLAKILHAHHRLLSLEIAPFTDRRYLRKIKEATDYFVLMSYDMHYSTSTPGPIASIFWVESTLNDVALSVPLEKVIVAVATTGYDWQQARAANDVDYNNAVNLAKVHAAGLTYDTVSGNLTSVYQDQAGSRHEIWITDATTIFNCVRASYDYQTAGTIMWRLGGEDERVWDFYGMNCALDSLRCHPFNVPA